MIDKVGALILVDRKILLARPKNKNAFLIPGGKREGDESDEQTLRREIMEELGTEIITMKHYGTFQDEAVFGGMVKIAAYLCGVKGRMKPQSEIEEIRFFGKDELQKSSGEYIGSVMKNHILPKLIADGLL
ncbi:MAG: NUDIX domain-containing protein [Candidatus Aenigmarchaeota archaeon]|nr:NUDIX domain-containing protein [Candidatus Aenigmarchaeota archaeon]